MKLIKASDFHICLCLCLRWGVGKAGMIPGITGGRSETLLDKQGLCSVAQTTGGQLQLISGPSSGPVWACWGGELWPRGVVEGESSRPWAAKGGACAVSVSVTGSSGGPPTWTFRKVMWVGLAGGATGAHTLIA